MNFKAVVTFIYAALVLIGGIIGFLKGSNASLIMGSLFAFLLALSAVGMSKNYLLGKFLAIGFTGALALFFSYRFAGSYAFMPAGLMAILSIIVLCVLIREKSTVSISRS